MSRASKKRMRSWNRMERLNAEEEARDKWNNRTPEEKDKLDTLMEKIKREGFWVLFERR